MMRSTRYSLKKVSLSLTELGRSTSLQTYWSDKTSSGHRYSTELFFADKAREHHLFLQNLPGIEDVCDIGCGTGELFRHYIRLGLRMSGIDFSQTMIDVAKTLNPEASDRLQHVQDTSVHISTTTSTMLISCGALGQYSTFTEIHSFLVEFLKNSNLRSFVLFDCIEPSWYRYFQSGAVQLPPSEGFNWTNGPAVSTSRYRSLIYLRARARRLRLVLAPLQSDTSTSLKNMGYAHPAAKFQRIASDLGLLTKFACSSQYEYRYHVAFYKNI